MVRGTVTQVGLGAEYSVLGGDKVLVPLLGGRSAAQSQEVVATNPARPARGEPQLLQALGYRHEELVRAGISEGSARA